MFIVNRVCLFLLVGVLCESCVDAAEHQRERPSDLREKIVAAFDGFLEATLKHDKDAIETFLHPDGQFLVDGFPPFVGKNGELFITHLTFEGVTRVENTYKEIQPMDKDEEYVYINLHFDFFNELDENVSVGNGLFIFRKTGDGYNFYLTMFNRHGPSTSTE